MGDDELLGMGKGVPVGGGVRGDIIFYASHERDRTRALRGVLNEDIGNGASAVEVGSHVVCVRGTGGRNEHDDADGSLRG